MEIPKIIGEPLFWLSIAAVCIIAVTLGRRHIRRIAAVGYSYSVYWMDAHNGQEPGWYYKILNRSTKPVTGDGPFHTEDAASIIASMDCDLWNKHGRGLKSDG